MDDVIELGDSGDGGSMFVFMGPIPGYFDGTAMGFEGICVYWDWDE